MPNGAQIHLALNHMPAAINLAAILVLLIALLWRSAAVLRTSLLLMIFAALLTIPAYLSGDPAEHLVEDLDRVNEPAIHPHEEAGEFAFIAMLVQGALALFVLILSRKTAPKKWMVALVLLIALISTGALFRTAFLGGKIQHPETQMAAPPEHD